MSEEYTVLRIWQLTRMNEVSGVEPYYRVTIKTKEGTVLDVDIDKKDWTETKVKTILTKEAQTADKIKSG